MSDAARDRILFRKSLEESGCRPDLPWLSQYEEIRKNPGKRLSRAMEELLEYALYLEDRLDETINKKELTIEEVKNAFEKPWTYLVYMSYQMTKTQNTHTEKES